MTRRVGLVAAIAVTTLWWPPVTAEGQRRAADVAKPQVEIVQTVGCVERPSGGEAAWWLTHATDAEVTRSGAFNEVQVGEAREAMSGSREFRLIGVADFLTPEGLLRFGDRALFTTPEQINATGELRDGRTVLVKGLLIDPDGEPRINLLAVIGLADTCN